MEYVKLIAKPNTWYKAGTEVYHYDSTESNKRRVTVEEWDEMVKDGMYCLRGTRVKEFESENNNLQIGGEYFDGECGPTNEFEVTIVEEII